MPKEVIRSRANATVKRARAAREGRERGLVFVEGVRLCEEAARSGLKIEEVLYTERLSDDERGARLLEALGGAARRVSAVAEDVFSSLSDTKTPQGVVALAERPRTDAGALDRDAATDATDERDARRPLLVVLHGVGNPSNAGAMLRVAEAAGATGVIATAGSADLFSPKALRGAMGSSFRVPVWAGATFAEALRWCAERGVRTVSTDVRATRSHAEIDWTVASAVVMGSEGGGLLEDERDATDLRLRIPMRPPVESLNVAVALAVVLYEAARQRGAVESSIVNRE
ncbi:MAG TPA: RNA methyltransferase [Pyrinomonadaceae bacterium]|nr:RNA methyltransferase [Pyrinomonadaceae bacterium]